MNLADRNRPPKKNILFLGLFFAALLVVIFLLFQSREKETIKIGAIISLSGYGSHLVDLRDAMLLAVDEINSQGGVNGRKIELLIEDSKTDPEEAKAAFERLENGSKKPVLYVSTHSNVSIALAPLAAKHQVVLVGLNTSAPEFIKNEWVYRHFITAGEEGRVAQRLLSELKVQSLGIFNLDDPYGNSVVEALEKNLADTGVKIIKTVFQNDVQDMTPQIEAVQGMQAVYLAGFVKHVAMGIRQLRQANYQGIIITPSGGANPKVTTLPEAEGVYVLAPIVYNPNYQFARDFQEKFESTYNKPFSHNAANGYDFVKIFAGLIDEQEVSRRNIKHILDQGFMYSGVLGYQELEPGGQEILLPLHPTRIQDGNLTFLRKNYR
ncbi:MAG: ABC transporter substrate-binding protein [Proteobacteria bacterium]|nr:ABC transporter substrate-binding protein [Pseudomonadota bacterium]MBU1710000.1 ABC transporter substrate-binding protein [Pseudomonadota bacterium]